MGCTVLSIAISVGNVAITKKICLKVLFRMWGVTQLGEGDIPSVNP